MFEPTSRYATLTIHTYMPAQGDGRSRAIRYVERRFLPAPGVSPILVEHTVMQGDRLDNVTAKYLGDPTQFWRVADANESLRPEELTTEIGRPIMIKLSQ